MCVECVEKRTVEEIEVETSLYETREDRDGVDFGF